MSDADLESVVVQSPKKTGSLHLIWMIIISRSPGIRSQQRFLSREPWTSLPQATSWSSQRPRPVTREQDPGTLENQDWSHGGGQPPLGPGPTRTQAGSLSTSHIISRRTGSWPSHVDLVVKLPGHFRILVKICSRTRKNPNCSCSNRSDSCDAPVISTDHRSALPRPRTATKIFKRHVVHEGPLQVSGLIHTRISDHRLSSKLARPQGRYQFKRKKTYWDDWLIPEGQLERTGNWTIKAQPKELEILWPSDVERRH